MSVFKQQFSVFKQHFTYFNTLFHPHVFPQKFLNNNFQFLNTYTKRALKISVFTWVRITEANGYVYVQCPVTLVASRLDSTTLIMTLRLSQSNLAFLGSENQIGYMVLIKLLMYSHSLINVCICTVVRVG